MGAIAIKISKKYILHSRLPSTNRVEFLNCRNVMWGEPASKRLRSNIISVRWWLSYGVCVLIQLNVLSSPNWNVCKLNDCWSIHPLRLRLELHYFMEHCSRFLFNMTEVFCEISDSFRFECRSFENYSFVISSYKLVSNKFKFNVLYVS